jgi:hypothetical protein
MEADSCEDTRRLSFNMKIQIAMYLKRVVLKGWQKVQSRSETLDGYLSSVSLWLICSVRLAGLNPAMKAWSCGGKFCKFGLFV